MRGVAADTRLARAGARTPWAARVDLCRRGTRAGDGDFRPHRVDGGLRGPVSPQGHTGTLKLLVLVQMEVEAAGKLLLRFVPGSLHQHSGSSAAVPRRGAKSCPLPARRRQPLLSPSLHWKGRWQSKKKREGEGGRGSSSPSHFLFQSWQWRSRSLSRPRPMDDRPALSRSPTTAWLGVDWMTSAVPISL